jgi:hypothetical protein
MIKKKLWNMLPGFVLFPFLFSTLAGICLASPTPGPRKENYTVKNALSDFKEGRTARIDQKYTELLPQGGTEGMKFYLITVALGQPANIAKLKKWKEKNPKSPTAWAAFGLAHLEKAKTIRKTAPRSKAFKENYAIAESNVDKAYGLSPKDINMSSFQIECRKVGGWGRR